MTFLYSSNYIHLIINNYMSILESTPLSHTHHPHFYRLIAPYSILLYYHTPLLLLSLFSPDESRDVSYSTSSFIIIYCISYYPLPQCVVKCGCFNLPHIVIRGPSLFSLGNVIYSTVTFKT